MPKVGYVEKYTGKNKPMEEADFINAVRARQTNLDAPIFGEGWKEPMNLRDTF